MRPMQARVEPIRPLNVCPTPMTAPHRQWAVTAHPAARGRQPLAHVVTDTGALCGVPVTHGWRPAAGEPSCRRCAAVADGSHVTQSALVDAGITYRQLDHWVRAGYVRCAVPAAGSGSQRLFLATEVRVVADMARLIAAGLTVWAAERAARGEQLPGGVHVTTGSTP